MEECNDNDDSHPNHNFENDDSDCDDQSSDESDNSEEKQDEEIVTLYEEDVKPGLSFKSKEIAMKSLKFFFADHYHPCVVTSNGTNKKKDEEGAKGRVRFMCTHGYKRRYTATQSRPVQRVNFTGCKCGLNINEQNDGSWKVGAKVILDHTGHEIGMTSSPPILSPRSSARMILTLLFF